MSRLVARILLSIFLLPLAGLLYLLTLVIAEEIWRPSSGYGREVESFVSADLLTWVSVALYWILLWRRSVRWSPPRVRNTVLAALIAAVAGVAAGTLVSLAADGGSGFAIFVGGVLTIMLWLIATVLIWRETAMEHSSRVGGGTAVTCPTCGYNLTGLTQSRCPECGSQFTLNELLAAQPTRSTTELE